jgi:hypothetical protein
LLRCSFLYYCSLGDAKTIIRVRSKFYDVSTMAGQMARNEMLQNTARWFDANVGTVNYLSRAVYFTLCAPIQVAHAVTLAGAGGRSDGPGRSLFAFVTLVELLRQRPASFVQDILLPGFAFVPAIAAIDICEVAFTRNVFSRIDARVNRELFQMGRRRAWGLRKLEFISTTTLLLASHVFTVGFMALTYPVKTVALRSLATKESPVEIVKRVWAGGEIRDFWSGFALKVSTHAALIVGTLSLYGLLKWRDERKMLRMRTRGTH